MKIRTYILLFFLFSLDLLKAGLPDSLINRIDYSPKKVKGFTININGGRLNNSIDLYWLYFPGDNSKWKFNDQNDSGFTIITDTQLYYFEDDDKDDEKRENEIDFNGIGWYKLYFKVPEGQDKKNYSLTLSQLGACEFYFDGKLLKVCGEINSNGSTKKAVKSSDEYISYYIPDTLPHVIAIRYSSSDFKTYYEEYKFREIGPNIRFNNSETQNKQTLYLNLYFNITNMISAFFIALFVIHLLIYLFYREKTFNLLYSLFLLFLSLCFFEFYYVKFIENPKTYLLVNHFDAIFFPACCFFLVTLLNRLLNVKRTKHYLFFVGLFILLILDTIFFWGIDDIVLTSMVFYTYFNTLAHSIVGIRRKIPSSKFLGWGILSFTICIIIAITFAVTLSARLPDNPFLLFLFIAFIILAILSIPLSMTAYLAFDFSRTNKDLSDQLKANEELNRIAREKEKEKQEILENQNKMLELQVTERTKEIAEQNKLLEHQKKEITDSINYAKRIQQALLPELDSITKALPNSFVYYVPKDIVSGDFYFFNAFSKKEDHPGRMNSNEEGGLFIAAADCTGHGVPGALMSMIVHEKLENATKYHGEPADILHSVNKQVKDALKQHQTDASRDGCDIALCKIQGNTLTYAGAYRPLYLFYKNGDFVEVKATKTAIAGLTPYDQRFEQHQFNTSELKAVYMFSDGFADQFGGQKTKKLTTKKFKELLAKIVNSPINEQKGQLEAFFENWRGNVEQIDDVLVIGIAFS